jgi:photosystem II stability/assembly factor-like uncharacterized protein
MRIALLLLAAAAAAQSAPRVQLSHTTESLRGVSAVSLEIAWASGTHGTYLRTTDGGRTWTPAQVPDATTLDFRAVVAFSATEAFLMSAGPGDQSRIYHTTDAGQHWQLQFTNTNPLGFFDSMVFWNPTHGVVLGDPIPDDTGKLKFELLITVDGQTWHQIPPAQLPEAKEGEGAFAASNTCLAIVNSPRTVDAIGNAQTTDKAETTWKSGPSGPRKETENERALAPAFPDANIWFATGGRVARVFHSPDLGQTWQVFDTPINHGPDSAGIFSTAFRDPLHGVIVGGDYKHPNDDGPNLAFTDDGGKTWTLSAIHPQAYFSAVAYDRKVNQAALVQRANDQSPTNKKPHVRPVTFERLFLIGQDFVFDIRPPNNPRRISPKKNSGIKFNAISPYPKGGALIVGPKGSIASIP